MDRIIQPQDIEKSVFELIGKDWMLITASKKDGATNTMTASWGGLGVMWNTPVAFIFIRPQRYTREFVENSEQLSLSFFDESHRSALSYIGRVSGKKENKIEKANLNLEFCEGVPYFEEAKLTLICTKLYSQQLEKDGFVDKSIYKKNYLLGDLHYMYVVKIDKAIKKEKN